ncbi:MAG: nucleotidyltransferase family protein [Bacteroidales bacterium]|nr:nucleotidyltransferase family protein [Bacteroidales bacterium]
MKAMILAAGLGTRLGEISKDTPKVLLDINGITVLERILLKLESHGFNDIIINVHHHAGRIIEAVKEFQEKFNVNISISDESGELLETGGGLYRVRDFFEDKPFLVYNGDILTDLNLEKMYEYHVSKGAIATIAVRNREGNRAFLVDDEGVIRGWTNRENHIDIITIEKPMNLHELPSMAIAVYDPEIFDYMEKGKYTMTSIILKATATGRVIAFRYDRGYWVDIGTPEQLEKARHLL